MHSVITLTVVASLAFAAGTMPAAAQIGGIAAPNLVLPLVKAELPAGRDIVTADAAELADAVGRAAGAQPELAPAIVEAVLTVAPEAATLVAAAAATAAPALAPEVAAAAARAVPGQAVAIAAAVTAAVPGSAAAVQAAVAAEAGRRLTGVTPAGGVDASSRSLPLAVGSGRLGSPN